MNHIYMYENYVQLMGLDCIRKDGYDSILCFAYARVLARSPIAIHGVTLITLMFKWSQDCKLDECIKPKNLVARLYNETSEQLRKDKDYSPR